MTYDDEPDFEDSFITEDEWPVAEPAYVYRDTNEVIAGLVLDAKATMAEFISEITARHIREMYGNSNRQFAGYGVFDYSICDEVEVIRVQNWNDPYGVVHVVPRKRTTRLTMTGDERIAQSYRGKEYEIVNLDHWGIPGFWIVQRLNISYDSPSQIICTVIFDKVSYHA